MDSSTVVLKDSSVWISSIICLVILFGFYCYETTYRYWDKRGIKGVHFWPIVNTVHELLFKNRAQVALERTRTLGKVHGTFLLGQPRIVVADAEVMRQICIKDFDHFQNHRVNDFANKYQRNFLVWLKGDHWKRVRTMMSPAFTSGKIKRMYKLMGDCADDLVDHFWERFARQCRLEREAGLTETGLNGAIVDAYEVYSMYTLDGITTCCYGLRLKRESSYDFKKNNRVKSSSMSSRNSLLADCQQLLAFSWLRLLCVAILPKRLLKLFGFTLSSESGARPLLNRIKKMIEIRRQTPQKYDDLLQMLVDASLDDKLELSELDSVENHHAGLTHESLLEDREKMRQSSLKLVEENRQSANISKLTDLEIESEATFLLVAGLDTTRSSLATITYLLAHHADIQERLYEEIKKIANRSENQVGHHLSFDYDTLTSCQYLDAVISESLRFFTPAFFTDRDVVEDYYIEKYNVQLRKGDQIILGIHSVHHDPDYWHEPEVFNPDRFMPGQREKIVPGSYAPFSMGPRHCIGMRFSLTETKLGLAKVIMNFKLEPAPGTKYPPEPNRGIALSRIENCIVRIYPRD